MRPDKKERVRCSGCARTLRLWRVSCIECKREIKREKRDLLLHIIMRNSFRRKVRKQLVRKILFSHVVFVILLFIYFKNGAPTLEFSATILLVVLFTTVLSGALMCAATKKIISRKVDEVIPLKALSDFTQ